MSHTNFGTANETLRKLLGNGMTYHVPSFQRDYSWGGDEWDDLWNDLISLNGEGDTESHYMGYLVLQSADSKKHDVIDGQQRLTTLSIIILAAVKRLQELSETIDDPAEQERNRKRAEQFREKYIGSVDPITFVAYPILTLNRHNNDFYQTFMIPLKKMPQRGIRASEHSLRKALNWFYDRIKQETKSGEEIAVLLTTMVDKLFFTTINVTDELNAFKVFETLNARGVKLSSTDLLKNFLFSTVASTGVHQHELNRMESLWERIVGVLGAQSFPDFLRSYWNSKRKLVRKNDLFKTIKGEIKDRSSAFRLIEDLHTYSEVYVGFLTPHDSLWNAEERQSLEALRLFNTRQQLPLLLAAYQAFFEDKRELFTRTIKYIATISFRYNVISGMHTNEQERVYSKVAQEISHGNITTRASLLAGLSSIYLSDKLFMSNFSEKELVTTNSRNNKVVRYILFQLEHHRTQAHHDIGDSNITIEHIYPQRPSEEWLEEDKHATYLLANMTLLERNKNKEVENLSFPEKRATLQSSTFTTSSQLADKYEEWNLANAYEHQRSLAKEAAQIWRIEMP